MSDYPEHDRMREIADKSQSIGEFLDWAAAEKGLHLYSIYVGSHGERDVYSSAGPVVDLLAEFFEIDLDKVEQEKRAMLDLLRSRADA